jgi:lipoprotein NlpI
MVLGLRIRTFHCFVFGAFIGVGLLPGPASALTQQQIDWCKNKDNAYSPDLQISGCTAVIESGKWSGKDLAWAYNGRGVAYNDKYDPDHALQDANEAIRLDPKYAVAYRTRGSAHLDKGAVDRAITDYTDGITIDPQDADPYIDRGSAYRTKSDFDRAIIDADQSIRLNPKKSIAYFNRGITFLYSGSLPKAVADFNQASELDHKDAYSVLWLEIANKRSNLASRLPQAISQLDMTKWPAPVIRLFLGQLTPEAVLAAAADPDAQTNKGQVCEANFYSGELTLQQGAKDDATRLFRLAAANCIKGFVEEWAANTELKALGVHL